MPQNVHFCIGRDTAYWSLFVFIIKQYDMYFRMCIPLDCAVDTDLASLEENTKVIWSREK